MNTTSFKRRILNTLNALIARSGIRMVSATEYEHLAEKPAIDRLRLQSQQTALAGTLTAFAGYLTRRTPAFANTAGIHELAGYLQHPTTLANQVLATAANHDAPVDKFMHYFAQHFHESNSQWSQDMFVSYILNRKSHGTFLEMGGADGITHSNTLSLEDCHNWSGTLIEPHPEQYRVLSKTRGKRSNRLMNCAATPSTKQESLELFDAGQLSSLTSYAGNDLHQQSRNGRQKRVSVTALPFQTIMQDVGQLDYLSLDVEGPELALLNAIDWKRQPPPKVITVEHNWRPDTVSGIRESLRQVGYTEAFPEDDWLRRGDLWFFHPTARN
jgi:hypothetical protein